MDLLRMTPALTLNGEAGPAAVFVEWLPFLLKSTVGGPVNRIFKGIKKTNATFNISLTFDVKLARSFLVAKYTCPI